MRSLFGTTRRGSTTFQVFPSMRSKVISIRCIPCVETALCARATPDSRVNANQRVIRISSLFVFQRDERNHARVRRCIRSSGVESFFLGTVLTVFVHLFEHQVTR